jgi:hypothetical protein
VLGFLNERLTGHVHAMRNQELHTEFWYGSNFLQYKDGNVILKLISDIWILKDLTTSEFTVIPLD